MKILLDIDGVMVITPTWQQPEFLPDGFMAFDKQCANNLTNLITHIKMQNDVADIVMTSTHRIHYTSVIWKNLLNNRGIFPDSVSIINEIQIFKQIGKRVDEVITWINANASEAYIILDDDKSLRELPEKMKNHWIECNFLTGFNAQCLKEALELVK